MLSNAEWKAWGKRDPLWGVASHKGRERGSANPWTDDEFYALGQDWTMYERVWRAAGAAPDGTVLEIGCGAGRITQMLVHAFDRVIAVDISPDMIAYAKTRVPDELISWRVGNGDSLPCAGALVDAVFSCQVFQHFPDNAAQLAMFGEIARVLKPGGTFLIDLPMHRFPIGRFAVIARAGYAAYLRIQRAQAFVQRGAMRFGFRPPMRMISYETERLLEDLTALGFTELEILGGARCIFGRKSLTA